MEGLLFIHIIYTTFKPWPALRSWHLRSSAPHPHHVGLKLLWRFFLFHWMCAGIADWICSNSIKWSSDRLPHSPSTFQLLIQCDIIAFIISKQICTFIARLPVKQLAWTHRKHEKETVCVWVFMLLLAYIISHALLTGIICLYWLLLPQFNLVFLVATKLHIICIQLQLDNNFIWNVSKSAGV